MLTDFKSIKRKQLPAHSISMEMHSAIAQFLCNSIALVYF